MRQGEISKTGSEDELKTEVIFVLTLVIQMHLRTLSCQFVGIQLFNLPHFSLGVVPQS